jgi:hypothetical protein
MINVFYPFKEMKKPIRVSDGHDAWERIETFGRKYVFGWDNRQTNKYALLKGDYVRMHHPDYGTVAFSYNPYYKEITIESAKSPSMSRRQFNEFVAYLKSLSAPLATAIPEARPETHYKLFEQKGLAMRAEDAFPAIMRLVSDMGMAYEGYTTEAQMRHDFFHEGTLRFYLRNDEGDIHKILFSHTNPDPVPVVGPIFCRPRVNVTVNTETNSRDNPYEIYGEIKARLKPTKPTKTKRRLPRFNLRRRGKEYAQSV